MFVVTSSEYGRIKVLTSYIERLRGLLFSKPPCETVLLVSCCAVHTWFMRYALDVAFFDADGHVVGSYKAVRPMKAFRHKEAVYVLERFVDTASYWPTVGERFSWSFVREAPSGDVREKSERAKKCVLLGKSGGSL